VRLLPWAATDSPDNRRYADFAEYGFDGGLSAGAGGHSSYRPIAMQFAAVAGLFASLLIWLIVALVTPAPMYLRGVAIERARVLQDRIPEHLRERLPRNVA
jgi:hypothetical protein